MKYRGWESRLWTAERVAEWLDDPGVVFVINLSGGKDSVATALYFREAGIPHRLVFADTGWEADETYDYIDRVLLPLFGKIDRVGAEGGMVGKIRERAGFPARRQRWCTKELKVLPMREYFNRIEGLEGVECVCVTGIRVEETNHKGDGTDRATWPMVEYDHEWDGWMFRPILRWSVAEVLAIHHRHGVPVNPLYFRGHNRVGCYPCIMSNKTDIRLVAEHAPERIALIRELEVEQTAKRSARNAEAPGRYTYADATFFQTLIGDRSHYRGTGQFIDEIVAWSKTTRGGRQLPLAPEPPDGGCFRWGMCEAPESPDAEEDRDPTELSPHDLPNVLVVPGRRTPE